MVKSSLLPLIFFLIFAMGILGIILDVNNSFDQKSSPVFEISPQSFNDPSKDRSYL